MVPCKDSYSHGYQSRCSILIVACIHLQRYSSPHPSFQSHRRIHLRFYKLPDTADNPKECITIQRRHVEWSWAQGMTLGRITFHGFSTERQWHLAWTECSLGNVVCRSSGLLYLWVPLKRKKWYELSYQRPKGWVIFSVKKKSMIAGKMGLDPRYHGRVLLRQWIGSSPTLKFC